jgi:hypothetical protein
MGQGRAEARMVITKDQYFLFLKIIKLKYEYVTMIKNLIEGFPTFFFCFFFFVCLF